VLRPGLRLGSIGDDHAGEGRQIQRDNVGADLRPLQVVRTGAAGREIRPEDDHFRTAAIATRIVAEEKTYNGTWVPVKYSKVYSGHLGATRDAGANNVSPFVWNGMGTNPKLTIRVKGFDDLFRLRIVTRVFSDEGALLARLVTHEGTCRV
jgi:hypothetical protein